MSDTLWGYQVPFGRTHVVAWHALDTDRKYPVLRCNTASVQRVDAVVRLYPPFAHPDASGMCKTCLRIITGEATPAELRDGRVALVGLRCEWPGCRRPGKVELAHLHPRGMGGSKSRNVPGNVVLLCRFHHDVLDGRVVAGRRFETAELLKAYLRAVGR